MPIAIVGAGFAGLAAAVALARGGTEVVVLEARDRVGGRVWSQPFPASGPAAGIVERGAEFVLDGYDTLRRHVERAGLNLADTGMSYYVRDVPGIDADTLRDAGQRLTAAARNQPHDRPVPDVLRELALPDHVAEALLARIEISCATSADRLDTRVIEHVASLTPLPSWRIAEGNQALAEALATELGDRVRLGHAVEHLEQDDSAVRIQTTEGVVAVDRAVITVPAPVLRDLPFDPPLPDAKRDALDRLEYGHAAKLHLLTSKAPRATAVMAAPDRYWTWTATNLHGEVPPIVNCFAGSASALDRLEVSEGPHRWIEQVTRLRQDLTIRADDALLTTWTDDPWSRGAYTAGSTVGADERSLARPDGRLHFAGEHTAGAWSGLMEGALRSGERAAAEVTREQAERDH